jgi:hypothetical protein
MAVCCAVDKGDCKKISSKKEGGGKHHEAS